MRFLLTIVVLLAACLSSYAQGCGGGTGGSRPGLLGRVFGSRGGSGCGGGQAIAVAQSYGCGGGQAMQSYGCSGGQAQAIYQPPMATYAAPQSYAPPPVINYNINPPSPLPMPPQSIPSRDAMILASDGRWYPASAWYR